MRKLHLLASLAVTCSFAMFANYGVANDLAQKSWQDIEAQAKQEGQVTVSIWYLQPQFRTFVKDFENQYGIKVKIPEGTIDGNMNKLLAERDLEKGKMDVVALGSDDFRVIQKNDILQPLKQIPSFEKANHRLQGIEFGDYAVGYWGNQTGFAYDPLKISEDKLPQTWQDVENYLKDHPKKFGYADPNGGGSGKAFIERAIVNFSGSYDYKGKEIDQAQAKSWQKTWDWFLQNKENFTRTSSNADSLTRLNDGELDIVSAWQDHLFSLQKQGAITSRLKFYVPKFGMPGGGNVMVIAKNAAHPAASLVFVNWIASPEVQQKLSQQFGVRPLSNEEGTLEVLFFSKEWSKFAMAQFTKDVISK